eukprot:403341375
MTQKLHPIVIISPQIETIIPEETTHLLTNNNSSLEENNDSIVSQNSIENTTTKNNKKHRNTQQQQSSNGVQRVNNKKKFVSQDIVLESANMKIMQFDPRMKLISRNLQQNTQYKKKNYSVDFRNIPKSPVGQSMFQNNNMLNKTIIQLACNQILLNKTTDFEKESRNFNTTLGSQVFPKQHKNEFKTQQKFFNRRHRLDQPHPSLQKSNGFRYIIDPANQLNNPTQTILSTLQSPQSRNFSQQNTNFLQNYTQVINNNTLNNDSKQIPCSQTTNNFHKVNSSIVSNEDFNEHILVIDPRQQQNQSKFRTTGYYSIDYARNNTTNMLQTTLNRQKLLSQQKLQQLSQKETMGHEQEEILENYQKELRNVDEKIIQESPDDKQTSVILNKSLESRNKKARLFNQNQRLLMYKRQYFNDRNQSLQLSKTENQQNSQQNHIILLPKLTIIKPEQLQLSPQLKDFNNQPQKITKNSDMPSQRVLVKENQIDQKEQVSRDRNQISIKQYKKDMSEFLDIKNVNQNQRGTETLPQEKSQISNLNPASITDEKYQNDTKRTNSKIRESSLSQQKQHPIQKQNFEVQIKTKYNEKFADLSFMAQQQKKDSNFQSKRQSYDFDFKKLKTYNKSFENQRLKALLNNTSNFNPKTAQNNKTINLEHQNNSFSDNIPSKPLAVQEYVFMPQQFYQTSIVEKIPKFLLKNREQNLRQFMNVLRVSHPELARDIKIRGDRR